MSIEGLEVTAKPLLQGPPIATRPVQILPSAGLRDPLSNRVTVSSGTELAEACPRSYGPFLPGARLPRLPWRAMTAAEFEQHTALVLSSPAESVQLVALNQEVLSLFRDAGLHDAWTLEDASRLLTSSAIDRALERLAVLLSPYRRGSESPDAPLEPPLPRLPGLLGTTRDFRRDTHHIGLHLDSWQSTAPQQRHLSTGRLCINIGPQDRFFLFLPRTIARLTEFVRPAENWTVNQVANEYLRRHPDEPIVRLRVHPGEAYVAPTENLVHDGSTEEQSRIDWTVTWRGRWSFNNATRGS